MTFVFFVVGPSIGVLAALHTYIKDEARMSGLEVLDRLRRRSFNYSWVCCPDGASEAGLRDRVKTGQWQTDIYDCSATGPDNLEWMRAGTFFRIVNSESNEA